MVRACTRPDNDRFNLAMLLIFWLTYSQPHLLFLLLYIHVHPPQGQSIKQLAETQTPPSQIRTTEIHQMASSTTFLVLTALLALLSWQAIASDPSPLQDFCVADKDSHGMYLHIYHPNIC